MRGSSEVVTVGEEIYMHIVFEASSLLASFSMACSFCAAMDIDHVVKGHNHGVVWSNISSHCF